MSQLTVGKDVLSFCTKCKLNLGHTIVAMKDAKHIAKVKCNTCATIQAYKDPSNSSGPGLIVPSFKDTTPRTFPSALPL